MGKKLNRACGFLTLHTCAEQFASPAPTKAKLTDKAAVEMSAEEPHLDFKMSFRCMEEVIICRKHGVNKQRQPCQNLPGSCSSALPLHWKQGSAEPLSPAHWPRYNGESLFTMYSFIALVMKIFSSLSALSMSSIVRNATCKSCCTFLNPFTACCYHNPQSRPQALCTSSVHAAHGRTRAMRRPRLIAGLQPWSSCFSRADGSYRPLKLERGLCWFGIKGYGNLFPQSHIEDNEATKTPLNKESKIWLHANYRVGRAFVLHKPKLSIYCLPCSVLSYRSCRELCSTQILRLKENCIRMNNG